MLPITPEQLAKYGTEDAEQKALICWTLLPDTQKQYPELKWLFHIPNGGSRYKAEAAKLRAMGVKRGVPDLFLPVKRNHYAGLFIELKRKASDGRKAGKTSLDQEEFKTHLIANGYGAMICYGWEHARNILIEYLGFV